MRAIFFDEADARDVVRRLHADGFEARVERERLAGEDDDEDHPWAVLTDAPDFMLELLAEEHEGWVDGEESPPPPTPIELPTEPRRGQRP